MYAVGRARSGTENASDAERCVTECVTTELNMAAVTVFQRRNIDLFKTIILRLPKGLFCSADGNNVDKSNENISDDQGSMLRGKKLDLVVSSLRMDCVAASALGIGRRFVVNIEILLTGLHTFVTV